MTAPELVARCANIAEGPDSPEDILCPGLLRFRWGMSQAACDTCGAYCGIAVADWERVDRAGSVPDTGQAREPDDTLADPPSPRGSGPVEGCCGHHRKRCRFGNPHRWCFPWMVGGKLQRTAETEVCDGCGSVCTGSEEQAGDTVQAPDVAALRSALRRVADVLDFADDAIDPPITTEIDTNIVRMALLDTEDAPPAELRHQVRALLSTGTTPATTEGSYP